MSEEVRCFPECFPLKFLNRQCYCQERLWAPNIKTCCNIYPTRCNVTQFILSGNCSTCFGWYLHPSSRAQTTVATAPGTCHTVTTTCRYRGRVETGLNVLWVAYASSSNGVTNTICCRYSCLRSWWWVEVPSETCRAVSR